MTEAVTSCYLNQPFPTKRERTCMPFLLLPSYIPYVSPATPSPTNTGVSSRTTPSLS